MYPHGPLLKDKPFSASVLTVVETVLHLAALNQAPLSLPWDSCNGFLGGSDSYLVPRTRLLQPCVLTTVSSRLQLDTQVCS